MKHNQHIMFL